MPVLFFNRYCYNAEMLCNLYINKIHERCDTLVVEGNSEAPQDVVLPEKLNPTSDDQRNLLEYTLGS